jgi:hypothetical protein
MRSRPERYLQQTAERVYSIACECRRSCTGETGRPLAVRLNEHGHNMKEGFREKSKLAKHAYEEGHRVVWNEARILEIESNSRHRKQRESAHMECLKIPIRQPSLGISPVWIPITIDEVPNLRDHHHILRSSWSIR